MLELLARGGLGSIWVIVLVVVLILAVIWFVRHL